MQAVVEPLTVGFDTACAAAEHTACFENRDRHAVACKFRCGGHACITATDDSNAGVRVAK